MEQRKNKLFEHIPHFHVPQNVNDIKLAEQEMSGFNQKIAVGLTKGVGSMTCAYIFFVLAIIGFPGLLGASASMYVQWISQTCIQLVMLSIIMVGQSVLGRHQELQSDEQFATTQHSFADIEQIMDHLDKQDDAILEILRRLEGGNNNGQTTTNITTPQS